MLTNVLDAKRLGILRQTLPQSKTIAFLQNPNFPEARNKQQRTKEAAEALGVELVVLSASSETEINDVMSNFDRQRLNGLLIVGDPFFKSHRAQSWLLSRESEFQLSTNAMNTPLLANS